MDDSTALGADIEFFPTLDRFHFVALLITWVKALRVRAVAAYADPRLIVAFLVGDVLFSVRH